jgi:hypothetical protein
MKRDSLTAAEQNARRFEEAAERTRSAIRVFPDYADTVIWFRGPVPYELTALTPRLIRGLEEWESRYYESIDDSYEFVSGRAESAHITTGLELARRLSEEIGDVLPVEVDERGGGKAHFLTPGRGTNPDAQDAFARMLADAESEDARIAAQLRSGATFDLCPS